MEKPEKTPIKVERTRKPISIEPPTLRNDTESIKVYQDLLHQTPDMPIFNNLEEVTTWLDKVYRPFLQAVRHELPK